jgi:hypothetical protein
MPPEGSINTANSVPNAGKAAAGASRKRDEDFKNIFEPVAQWNVADLVCGALRELAYAVAGRKTWAGHFSDRLLAETRRRLNLEESDTLAREARVPVKPPGLTEPSS